MPIMRRDRLCSSAQSKKLTEMMTPGQRSQFDGFYCGDNKPMLMKKENSL